MKRFLLFLLAVFSAVSVFADSYYIDVSQELRVQGEKYEGQNLPNASIAYEKISNGTLYLKYDFSMNAKKDWKNSFVYCKIEFPEGLNPCVVSFDGLAAFEIDSEQIPSYLETNSYVEFFMPVRKNGQGFIELRLSVLKQFKGSNIPVKIGFEEYEKRSAGIAIITSPGLIWTAYKYVMEKNAKMFEEKMNYIKDNYKRKPLTNSLKRYSVQIL